MARTSLKGVPVESIRGRIYNMVQGDSYKPPFSRHLIAKSSSEPHHLCMSTKGEGDSSSNKTSEQPSYSNCKCESNKCIA